MGILAQRRGALGRAPAGHYDLWGRPVSSWIATSPGGWPVKSERLPDSVAPNGSAYLANRNFLEQPVRQVHPGHLSRPVGLYRPAETLGPQWTRELVRFSGAYRPRGRRNGVMLQASPAMRMIIFGLPVTQPDDASRGVAHDLDRPHIAHDLVGTCRRPRSRLSIRIGGKLGPVVVTARGCRASTHCRPQVTP